jgi:hypothetical protein
MKAVWGSAIAALLGQVPVAVNLLDGRHSHLLSPAQDVK